MHGTELGTIGILGVGRVGAAVARRALGAGFEVGIATAKPVDEIAMIVDIVTPGATAVDATVATNADLVVIAVPLHKYRTLDPTLFAGKTVIDVMNYWAPTDGKIDDFENDARSSSEVIQSFLEGAQVVKTLNHIGYHELEEDHTSPHSANRRALAIASDHADAKRRVATFIDRLGYDPVDAGPLATGRIFEPGTEIFNGSYNVEQLDTLLNTTAYLAHA